MGPSTSFPTLPSVLNLIRRWLAFQVYVDELPGLSVAISLGEETVFQEQYGHADLDAKRPLAPDSLFRIASHSKLFTATAVMRLRAQGAVRLDDRVAEHLDWFRSEKDPGLEQVTIRQLLTHSSGVIRDGDRPHWTYDAPFPDRGAVVRQVQNGISVFEGGEHWKYSNMGFTLLGEVVAAVQGVSYPEAMAELVLEPLGLENTLPAFSEAHRAGHAVGYTQNLPGDSRRRPLEHLSAGAMAPATGFSSTAADLVRFYRAHLFGDAVLLEDSDKREMQRVQFKDGDYEWGLGFGLNEIGGLKYAGHGGRYPGFITFSGVNQERKLIIVVLTNAVDGPARDLFEGISNLLKLALDQPERFEGDAAPDPAELDAVSGFYRSLWGFDGYGPIGGRLVGINPALKDPAAELDVYDRAAPLTYRVPIRDQFSPIGETLRFVPDEDGRIVRVLYPASTAVRWEIP